MSYPPSRDAAQRAQRDAEDAITALADLALELWLPIAADTPLTAAAAEPPPDPAAAGEKQAQWEYIVGAVVVFGIGIIAADTFDKAYTALTGAPLAAGRALARVSEPTLPGVPDRETLHSRAAGVLRARMGIDTDAVRERVRSVAPIRSFVDRHRDAIAGKVLDAVGRVFTGLRNARNATDVREVFDPANDIWANAAQLAGQTQSTSALNSAVDSAAQLASTPDRQLTVEWVTVHDARVRDAHEDADGQRQPPGASFTVGGEQLRFPADPTGSPENTANCRCVLLAFFTDEPGLIADSAPRGLLQEETAMPKYRSFTSVLAVIGRPTADRRIFAPDIDLGFRDFPLPLMWQRQSSAGHDAAFTVAVIESAGVVGSEIIGKGYALNTPEAAEAITMIEHGVTAPSVDLGDVEWFLGDAAGAPLTDDELENLDVSFMQVVTSAKVLGATLVAIPAFGETSIQLGEMVERGPEALVAAAGMDKPGLIDMPVYPAEFFTDPQFSGPTLPHITADGRVQGHLALFNVCHTGIADTCVIAPRSQTDYACFHTSPPVKTREGNVKVGRLTVGGGHAGPRLAAGPAMAHYDDTGTCFAIVHIGEDSHGVWFSGVANPYATPEQIGAGLSAPLSGDWRTVGGSLELVAALAVNTPGFPIIASGATDEHDEPVALIASLGPCPDTADGPQLTESQLRVFASAVAGEMRNAQRREEQAAKLISGEVRRQAIDIMKAVV